MNRINVKGITVENVTGILLLIAALVNTVLQMFGVRTLPIEDSQISDLVSALFLVVTTLWNTWKNRNITTISQEVQQVADALRDGEIPEEEIRAWIEAVSTKEG